MKWTENVSVANVLRKINRTLVLGIQKRQLKIQGQREREVRVRKRSRGRERRGEREKVRGCPAFSRRHLAGARYLWEDKCRNSLNQAEMLSKKAIFDIIQQFEIFILSE